MRGSRGVTGGPNPPIEESQVNLVLIGNKRDLLENVGLLWSLGKSKLSSERTVESLSPLDF